MIDDKPQQGLFISVPDRASESATCQHHAREMNYRSSLHLAHDVGAVLLNGFDADIQLAGNKLAGLAFQNVLHDFRLARSERCQAALEFRTRRWFWS